MSLTITWNEQLVVLPEGSVAVDVTVVFPTGKNDPETGVVVNVVEQLSEAVTEKLTIIPHIPAGAFVVMGAGQVITGAWLSTTVTLKVHIAIFPDTSVAVYVTR